MADRREGTKTSVFGTNGSINHDSTQFYDSKLYTELNNAVEAGEEINILPNETMKEIPNNSLHLMIKSPPYNVAMKAESAGKIGHLE